MTKEKVKKTSKKKTKQEAPVSEVVEVVPAPASVTSDTRTVKKNSLLPKSLLKPLEELSRRLDELETKIKKLID